MPWSKEVTCFTCSKSPCTCSDNLVIKDLKKENYDSRTELHFLRARLNEVTLELDAVRFDSEHMSTEVSELVQELKELRRENAELLKRAELAESGQVIDYGVKGMLGLQVRQNVARQIAHWIWDAWHDTARAHLGQWRRAVFAASTQTNHNV